MVTPSASPSQLGLVLVTAGSETEARAIAKSLIETQLAACVTLTPIRSLYRWQGVIHDETEYQLTIKTDLTLFKEIAAKVTQQHSYDLPEIIAVPIVESTQQYDRWVREQIV